MNYLMYITRALAISITLLLYVWNRTIYLVIGTLKTKGKFCSPGQRNPLHSRIDFLEVDGIRCSFFFFSNSSRSQWHYWCITLQFLPISDYKTHKVFLTLSLQSVRIWLNIIWVEIIKCFVFFKHTNFF